ncbi:hypothetical protein MAUB1S_09666 [Mycolicibacterium aubagnense]
MPKEAELNSMAGEALLSPIGVDLQAAADLGAKAHGIEIIQINRPEGMQGVPASIPAALRRGDTPNVENIAHLFSYYRTHPERKSGQALALTFETFCELTGRHKTEHSAIFANTDWKKPAFTAVIDYHEKVTAGRADNGKHRVHYAFPLSEEWQAWVAQDGKPMKQEEFAWFLEDRVAELSSPTDHEKVTYSDQFATTVATPAQVVELSRGLRVHIDTKVKASTTLQSGEGQIAWEETHNGDDGKPIKVPGLFLLYIAPFFMGEKVRIPVRLRYRVKDGQTVWFYQIYRPDIAITEHLREHMLKAKNILELPVFEGSPEMSA